MSLWSVVVCLLPLSSAWFSQLHVLNGIYSERFCFFSEVSHSTKTHLGNLRQNLNPLTAFEHKKPLQDFRNKLFHITSLFARSTLTQPQSCDLLAMSTQKHINGSNTKLGSRSDSKERAPSADRVGRQGSNVSVKGSDAQAPKLDRAPTLVRPDPDNAYDFARAVAARERDDVSTVAKYDKVWDIMLALQYGIYHVQEIDDLIGLDPKIMDKQKDLFADVDGSFDKLSETKLRMKVISCLNAVVDANKEWKKHDPEKKYEKAFLAVLGKGRKLFSS